jgi:nitrite reductase (NADH) large subunit
MPARRPLALAIIGNGMAACRLLDELVARGGHTRYEITVFGEEPGGAYNRILLSHVLGGDQPDSIVTKPPSWYRELGIRLVDAVAVKRLDTARKTVETADGARHRFDLAVLATGSQPLVPAIDGVNTQDGNLRPGAFVYRTMDDCLRMRAHVRPGASAIVLGGGLLGLESAKVLSDAGLHVTVVHAAETLMNAQLDPMAGEMLRRKIELCGIFVRTGRTIEAVLPAVGGDGDPDGPVQAVTLDDGKTLPADMVVLACGVRPRIDVARASGLPVNRGVVINDTLATEVPGIYAIGDCAEHRGQTYGVAAPAWEQAAVLADLLTGTGPQARYRGSKLFTRLKVAGVDVATMGTARPELETDDVIEVVEQARSSYRKLIMRDGRLMGAMLVGNTAAAASLVQLFDRGDPMPDDPLEALCPALVGAVVDPAEKMICNCNRVCQVTIDQAISAGCETVEAIGVATRAGTGCGSCKDDLKRLLTRRTAVALPLAAVG